MLFSFAISATILALLLVRQSVACDNPDTFTRINISTRVDFITKRKIKLHTINKCDDGWLAHKQGELAHKQGEIDG